MSDKVFERSMQIDLTALDAKQCQELIQYVLTNQKNRDFGIAPRSSPSLPGSRKDSPQRLTEVRVGDLYFCMESRAVSVCGKDVDLTMKEFDILSVIITNPDRVISYALIAEKVWHMELDCYTQKTISNHVSNLRRKLKIAPNIPNYIKSVHGVGYKLNNSIP